MSHLLTIVGGSCLLCAYFLLLSTKTESYKTWSEVGSVNAIYLKKDRFHPNMPKERRQTLKDLKTKNELPRDSFVYIDTEGLLLWHSFSGDFFEVVFKETEL